MTHHLSIGNVDQIRGVIAGWQSLRFQGAGILQLLDGGKLGLSVARLSDGETWQNQTTQSDSEVTDQILKHYHWMIEVLALNIILGIQFWTQQSLKRFWLRNFAITHNMLTKGELKKSRKSAQLMM